MSRKFLSVVFLVISTEISVGHPIWESGRQVAVANSATVLVERLMTFSYFIPTIFRLQHSQSPAAEVRAKFSQWITLNYVRVMFVLASWLVEPKH
jgi:hypothetical protein